MEGRKGRRGRGGIQEPADSMHAIVEEEGRRWEEEEEEEEERRGRKRGELPLSRGKGDPFVA